jgi:hypothetical protein
VLPLVPKYQFRPYLCTVIRFCPMGMHTMHQSLIFNCQFNLRSGTPRQMILRRIQVAVSLQLFANLDLELSLIVLGKWILPEQCCYNSVITRTQRYDILLPKAKFHGSRYSIMPLIHNTILSCKGYASNNQPDTAAYSLDYSFIFHIT